MTPTIRRIPLAAVALCAGLSIGVSSCNRTTSPLTSSDTSGTGGQQHLTISGTPSTSTVAGQAYSFQPTVSAPAGATLTFSITNKPAWASFSSSSGLLSGTPTAGAEGSYAGIAISVKAGTSSASLPAFTIQVVAPPAPTDTSKTLSQEYPGDVGMDADSSVVWHEAFSESTIAALTARYTNSSNAGGMSFVSDVPPNSSGHQAVQFVAGGANAATHLYTSFSKGYDELWYRYYVKYIGAGPWHHSGLWFGGFNPSLPYPYPHAGEKPVGNDRFSIALEPMQSVANPLMDFYAYWMQMHSWMANPSGSTAYYGNTLIHSNEFTVTSGVWACLEVHLKLNTDTSSGAGAALQVWKNDSLMASFTDTGPLGYWVADKFCPESADNSACTDYRGSNPTLVVLDQQWRSTAALKINNIWLENYNDSSTTSTMLYDDVVVATRRIGCTVKQ